MDWLEPIPYTYQQGDFHPGNLIYQDKEIGVIDFNRWEAGDSYEEFYKIQCFGKGVSIPYCVGQLDAYFEDEIPENFWKANAVYVAHATLYSIKWDESFGEEEILGMKQRARQARIDFEDYHRLISIWDEGYKKTNHG